MARAAHWIIRRPREAGGRACVNLVSNPFRKEAQGVRRARSDANGSYHPERTSFNFSTPNAYPALPILSNPSNFFQEVPNMLPRSPKRSQLMAKIAQNTPQEPPTRPPKTPKCGQNVVVLFVCFYTSAIFLKIAPKTNKNDQKSSPNGLKMAILAPTWKLLAPSWLQLGAILPHLGEILVDPSPAKIDQNQPRQLLRDFLSQGRPQELPDPLQTSIFQVFKYILKDFVYFSERLFIDSAFKVYNFLNTFS